MNKEEYNNRFKEFQKKFEKTKAGYDKLESRQIVNNMSTFDLIFICTTTFVAFFGLSFYLIRVFLEIF